MPGSSPTYSDQRPSTTVSAAPPASPPHSQLPPRHSAPAPAAHSPNSADPTPSKSSPTYKPSSSPDRLTARTQYPTSPSRRALGSLCARARRLALRLCGGFLAGFRLGGRRGRRIWIVRRRGRFGLLRRRGRLWGLGGRCRGLFRRRSGILIVCFCSRRVRSVFCLFIQLVSDGYSKRGEVGAPFFSRTTETLVNLIWLEGWLIGILAFRDVLSLSVDSTS